MKRKIIFTAAIILLCAGLFGLYRGFESASKNGGPAGNESGYFKNSAAPRGEDVRQSSGHSSSVADSDKQVAKSGQPSGGGEKASAAVPTPKAAEKLPDNFKVIDTVTNNRVLLSARVNFENTNAGDATLKALQNAKVQYRASGMGGAMYVSMIGGIAERSAGPSSGWCYYVNGTKPGSSASSYPLKKDDVLEWKFQKNGLNN